MALSAGAVFRSILGALESAGIPYMLTGSFAAAYHGTPRATQDIDLVIAPKVDQLGVLVRALQAAGYYVDLEAAREALRLEAQFNAIDPVTGWKVDFIIRKSRPFSIREFERRQRGQLDDLPLTVVTAEDVVLAKLEWARLAESGRQLEDVVGLLRVRGGEMDLAHIESWLDALGVRPQWEEALARARLPGTTGR